MAARGDQRVFVYAASLGTLACGADGCAVVAARADGAAPPADASISPDAVLRAPFTVDLGVNTAVTSGRPVRVVQVSAGYHETCAVLGDGTLRCWGGRRTMDAGVTSSAAPVPGVRDVVQVAVGWVHRCVRTRGGAVRCWGDNTFGQIGDGTVIPREVPVEISLPTAAAEVVAGDGATCARLVDGSARCWGRNSLGEVGDGTTEPRLSPARVRELDDVISIRVGRGYACAVRGDRSVWCWGASMFSIQGELPTPVPRRAFGSRRPVRAIGPGMPWGCVLYMDGEYECQTLFDHPTDEPNWGSSRRGGADLASSTTSHVALFVDGTVEGITRHYRPFGQGPIPDGALSAHGVARGIEDATQVTAGYDHACALLATGEVRCWGGNSQGQLGDGTLTFRDTPVTVLGLE